MSYIWTASIGLIAIVMIYMAVRLKRRKGVYHSPLVDRPKEKVAETKATEEPKPVEEVKEKKKEEEKKTGWPAWARVLTTVAVIAILGFVFWKVGAYVASTQPPIIADIIDDEPVEMADYSFPARLENVELAHKAYDHFKAKLAKREAFTLFRICEEASHFRQFKPNGQVLLGVIDKDHESDASGICQVRKSLFGSKGADSPELKDSKEYDVDKVEGNLATAVWVFQNRGPEAWDEYDIVRKELTKTVDTDEVTLGPGRHVMWARSDKKNRRYKVDSQYRTSTEFFGPVWIYTGKNHVPVEADVNIKAHLDWQPDYFEFRSRKPGKQIRVMMTVY